MSGNRIIRRFLQEFFLALVFGSALWSYDMLLHSSTNPRTYDRGRCAAVVTSFFPELATDISPLPAFPFFCIPNLLRTPLCRQVSSLAFARSLET